ncbi:MAG: FAD-binding protein [Planctomycetaceae bacterium]|nr:FAD-binding protein [Planctomycetaceae bacterium]
MRYDTLVIGAGFSGLAAGIRAAMFGRRVLVLERHYLWGGLNSFYKRKGRLFDTGLHALTNCGLRGAKGTPLGRLLRQLRIHPDQLQLLPQGYSELRLADLCLRFSNDPELWLENVTRAFRKQADRFLELHRTVGSLDIDRIEDPAASARAKVEAQLGDPELADVVLMAPTFYGSAREGDIDWDQFVMLYRAIFHDGLAQPEGGVRPLLQLFLNRLAECGGELRRKAGVERLLVRDGRVYGVRLEDGEEIEAEHVLSSAGWVETMGLLGPELGAAHLRPEDRATMTILETISVLDRPPKDIPGPNPLAAATVFFADEQRFAYGAPKDLCSATHGVLSVPSNFAAPASGPTAEPTLRATLMAHPEAWHTLPPERYGDEKQRWSERALDLVARLYGDPRPYEVYRDVFTPRTITKYTGHDRGAIYGSPTKHRGGATPFAGLYLIGADQGMAGIVGAGLSGATIVNLHVLNSEVA